MRNALQSGLAIHVECLVVLEGRRPCAETEIRAAREQARIGSRVAARARGALERRLEDLHTVHDHVEVVGRGRVCAVPRVDRRNQEADVDDVVRWKTFELERRRRSWSTRREPSSIVSKEQTAELVFEEPDEIVSLNVFGRRHAGHLDRNTVVEVREEHDRRGQRHFDDGGERDAGRAVVPAPAHPDVSQLDGVLTGVEVVRLARLPVRVADRLAAHPLEGALDIEIVESDPQIRARRIALAKLRDDEIVLGLTADRHEMTAERDRSVARILPRGRRERVVATGPEVDRAPVDRHTRSATDHLDDRGAHRRRDHIAPTPAASEIRQFDDVFARSRVIGLHRPPARIGDGLAVRPTRTRPRSRDH